MKMFKNAGWGSLDFLSDLPWDGEKDRANPEAIAYFEEHGKEAAFMEYSDPVVIELPDNTTDYMVTEYDGWESIIYVVDGKLYEA